MTTAQQIDDASPQTPGLRYVSCGCIWRGEDRTRVCPAHNRPAA